MRAVRHGFRAVAPNIDAGEQEQPDHVDEMPVPGGEFEAEMLVGFELPCQRADQAYDQEGRSDDDMGAMKTGRHEERGAIDVAAEIEGGVDVFPSLNAG